MCPACGHDDSLSKRDLPTLTDPARKDQARKEARAKDLSDMFRLIGVMGLVAVGGYLGERIGGTPGMVVGIIAFFLVGLVMFFR